MFLKPQVCVEYGNWTCEHQSGHQSSYWLWTSVLNFSNLTRTHFPPHFIKFGTVQSRLSNQARPASTKSVNGTVTSECANMQTNKQTKTCIYMICSRCKELENEISRCKAEVEAEKEIWTRRIKSIQVQTHLALGLWDIIPKVCLKGLFLHLKTMNRLLLRFRI